MSKRIIFIVLLLISFSLISLYAEAKIVYVVPGGAGTEDGSSWGEAFGTVSAGLVAAASGDEIWVAAGTYMPTSGSDRAISFNLKEGVGLYGGFSGRETAREERVPSANETILNGDIGIAEDKSDNSYHVVMATGELTAAAVLDGFTIMAGNADGDGDNEHGSGLYCSSSSPRVKGCTFSGNRAWDYGGGMYNENFSSPTVIGCTFSGNTSWSGSGMYNYESSPTVTGCTFSGNSAISGSGMYNHESSPTVTGCTFSGNSASDKWGNGGGMGNYYHSSPTVMGCTFSGNSAVSGGGMYNYESSPTVTGCDFSGNRVVWHGGGMLNSSSSPTVGNCTFSDNSANNQGGGMSNGGNSSPTVTGCTFSANSANNQGGGMSNFGSSPTIINCTFLGNSAACNGSGIYNKNSSPTVSNCILWNLGSEISGDGNPVVIYSCVQGGWPGEDNIDGDPKFVDALEGDFRLEDGSSCVDRGLVSDAPAEDILGTARPGGDGKVDMGAYESPDEHEPGDANHVPGVLYVKADALPDGDGSSWEAAFSTISSALYVSGASDEVRVGSGRYLESVWMEPGIGIFGGYAGNGDLRDISAHETIIDATGLGTSTVFGADRAILDGFTVTGGDADNGGGMYDGHCSPKVTNCTFSGNSAWDYGGGMYNHESSPTVTGCTFSNNSASDYGGGMYNENFSSPTVIGCTFSGNTSWSGGGMYNHESSPTVTGCTFSNNSASDDGGGMYNENFPSPTVIGCTFSGNSAGTGSGMANWASSPTVIGCTFSGNSAEYAGVMDNIKSSPTVSNCIIAFNSSGIYQYGGTLTITHSCVYNPDGVDHWNITDPTGTNGNISEDPIFVGTGDYHLKPGSPCIDTGDNSAVLETTDLDGNPRITDGNNDGDAVVDMGAYEYLPGYKTPMPTITDTPAITPTSTPTRFWDVETDGKVDEKDLLWFVKNYDGQDRDNLFFEFCKHWRENPPVQ